MGFVRVARSMGIPAQQVLSASYRLKVGRVDTGAITTQMVKLQAGGDRSASEFVGESMGWCCTAKPCGEAPVAAMDGSSPKPTVRPELNLLEKALRLIKRQKTARGGISHMFSIALYGDRVVIHG
jgi:hypothetical protein